MIFQSVLGTTNAFNSNNIALSAQEGVALVHSSLVLCVFSLEQEAGRYPAYKEMVAEYGWLDKRKLTSKYLKNIYIYIQILYMMIKALGLFIYF